MGKYTKYSVKIIAIGMPAINSDNILKVHNGALILFVVHVRVLLERALFTHCYYCDVITHASLHTRRGTLIWRHNERDGVSNHRRLDCFLNQWLRSRSKKTSKLRVTGLFVRGIHRWPVNSPHKWPVPRKGFHLMTSSWNIMHIARFNCSDLIDSVRMEIRRFSFMLSRTGWWTNSQITCDLRRNDDHVTTL